jgi:hypothetical protein
MPAKYEQLQLDVSEEELEGMSLQDVIQIMQDTNTDGANWRVVEGNNTARIDTQFGFIMIQNATIVGHGLYKFIKVGEFQSDLGEVSVWRHCNRLHPPVLIRLIPGPTIVMSLAVNIVNTDTVNVEAFYLSGTLAWAAHCDIIGDNKALRIRNRIRSHLIAIGRCSVNTTINLVLAGSVTVLRGNSAVWPRPRRRAQPRMRPAAAQAGIRRYMR